MPRRIYQQVLLLVSAFLLSCGCKQSTAPPPEAAAATNLPVITMGSNQFLSTLPRKGGPPGYIGSDSCKECHADQHSSWHRSFHRTMTREANAETVQADFNNVLLRYQNRPYILLKKGNELWVRRDPTESMIAEGFEPNPIEVRVGLVTGSHHMEVFWLPEGHGNMQVGFPFTWLIPEKRWVPRDTTFVRPPGIEHRPEAWNMVCSRCHMTGVEPNVVARERQIATEAVEMGISCEACHGPAGRHVELRKAALASNSRELLEKEIIQPEKLTAERSSQVCGFCHSMKWFGNEWLTNGFAFRPGDDLNATTPVIRPSRTNDVKELVEFLARSPEILNDFFWSDGMIRVSGREYNGLIESPCYKSEKFSCLSCHSMHESEPDDQLKISARGNQACTQCHAKYAPAEALTAHTRHGPQSSGSSCYNCHMPHTTYGVLKGIRSHQISSPTVSAELKTGRPNACNLCHLDKSLSWTANHLREWYQQPLPEIPKPAEAVASAQRLGLAGDAGQRVLIAWHLGWSAATQTSGTNWIPPLLAAMLDDPYAAVRCAAERSLKTHGVSIPDFLFERAPADRGAVFPEAWSIWFKQSAQSGKYAEEFVKTSAEFERWTRQRDERRVRLRE